MRPLLMIDQAGLLRLVDVDSGARIPVGDDERLNPPRRVVTAAWSQSGQWTAWSATDGVPGGVHELRLHDEQTDTVRTLAEFIDVFYVNPSPCGRYLAHLSSGPLGLELATTGIATGTLTVLERGQPLFWSWSPSSERIAIHVDRRVLVAENATGEVQLLAHDVGAFTAPAWLPGDAILVAMADQLVAYRTDGESAPVLDHLGNRRFVLSPDGRRVGLLGGAGARIVDLATGTERIVSEGAAPMAAFWSPDSTSLAVVEPTREGFIRWLVDDGEDLRGLVPFRPGVSWFRTVLPFFEQYAQSHDPWSGDSTQLVAPALDERGRGVALVHTVSSDHIETIPGVELAWWADH